MKNSSWPKFAILIALALLSIVLYVYQAASAPQTPAVPEHDNEEPSGQPESASGYSWLELPSAWMADAEYCLTHFAEMEGRKQRNYTILYDEDTYMAYWVAYPLCASHMSTGREEIWAYDPEIPQDKQTNVRSGYGTSVPTVNYPKNFYARGHQIPNADRNAVPSMQAQTYYSTNITPQIQNGFNGGIWAKLEEAVRGVVPQYDTLYVVTGAGFNRSDDSSGPSYVVNKNDGKHLPVPDYYWKALLKVRRQKTGLQDAVAIAFLLPHEDLKGADWRDYAVAVDLIEEKTGFDLFVNLQDDEEKPAETNQSWQVFVDF